MQHACLLCNLVCLFFDLVCLRYSLAGFVLLSRKDQGVVSD